MLGKKKNSTGYSEAQVNSSIGDLITGDSKPEHLPRDLRDIISRRVPGLLSQEDLELPEPGDDFSVGMRSRLAYLFDKLRGRA